MIEMIRFGGKIMFKKLINKKNIINNYNEELDLFNIFEYIVIIMDGNGWWVKKWKMFRIKGYYEGM